MAGLSNGHVTDDVTWPQRCCEAVRSAIDSDSLASCFSSKAYRARCRSHPFPLCAVIGSITLIVCPSVRMSIVFLPAESVTAGRTDRRMAKKIKDDV